MKLRCILLGLVIAFATLFSARAQAGCYEKFAFDQVRMYAKGALTRGGTLSDFQKTGLDHALRQLTLSPLTPRLQAKGMEAHAPFLNDMLAQLAELRRSGESRTTSLSFSKLDKATQIFEELCIVEQEINGSTKAPQTKHILERDQNTLSNSAVTGTKADIRSYTNLSLVFFFLLGLISLIVFCWKSYVIAFPLLMNRKSCKIQATLRVLDLDVPGHLMVLGTRGSRFVPNDADIQARLISLLKKLSVLPVTSMLIRGEPYAVKLHVVSTAHCVSFFETQPDRIVLNRLFSYSKEVTKFVPKTTIHSNLNSINPNFA